MKHSARSLRLHLAALPLLFAATPSTGQSPNVLTRQNDIGRTGRQLDENLLNTTNVTANGNSFGKVFKWPVTGQIYAQPLAVAGLAGVTNCHSQTSCNVVYVATENDYLYAFDADGLSSSVPLWSVNLATNVAASYSYVQCATIFSACNSSSAIYPNIGVTGTPVIDANSNTLYVVSAVDCGLCAYPQAGVLDYLHAINILTGAEQTHSPVKITASTQGAATPPAACATASQSGTINFDAVHQLQRPGLLELSAAATGYTNPVIYIGFSIYDGNPSTGAAGWVLGYDASTLAYVTAFNTTPYGTGGGIWESGAGLAAGTGSDGKTHIYVPTADGTFDATNPSGFNTDYGDSMLKLTITNGVLGVANTATDYFTPSDQSTRCSNDIDFGSGGVMILPSDVSVPNHRNLMVNASKGSGGGVYLNPSLWVIDRDSLGGFQTTGYPVEQAHTGVNVNGNLVGGYWTSPAYYEWTNSQSQLEKAIYYTMTLPPNVKPNPLNQYVLDSTDPIPNDGNGNAVPTNSTTKLFCPPVPTPSVSATPTNTNGILWAVENTNPKNTGTSADCTGSPSGAKLHAYDATNLGELYNSGSHITGNTPTKFVPPTVFNGRVYISTYQGLTLGGTNGELDVFGLCPQGVCIP